MTAIDRIEITGSVFTGPSPGNYHRASFDRPKTRISFSLLEPVEVPYYYSEGINNIVIANIAASIVGPGFYGIKTYREPKL